MTTRCPLQEEELNPHVICYTTNRGLVMCRFPVASVYSQVATRWGTLRERILCWLLSEKEAPTTTNKYHGRPMADDVNVRNSPRLSKNNASQCTRCDDVLRLGNEPGERVVCFSSRLVTVFDSTAVERSSKTSRGENTTRQTTTRTRENTKTPQKKQQLTERVNGGNRK